MWFQQQNFFLRNTTLIFSKLIISGISIISTGKKWEVNLLVALKIKLKSFSIYASEVCGWVPAAILDLARLRSRPPVKISSLSSSRGLRNPIRNFLSIATNLESYRSQNSQNLDTECFRWARNKLTSVVLPRWRVIFFVHVCSCLMRVHASTPCADNRIFLHLNYNPRKISTSVFLLTYIFFHTIYFELS